MMTNTLLPQIINLTFFPSCQDGNNFILFYFFLSTMSLSLNLKIVWGSIVMHHCLELTTELTISLQRRPASRNVFLARACSLTVDVTVGFLTCCQSFYLQPAIPNFTQFDIFIM